MNKLPFCGQCAFYGGRRNGVGVCNFGKTIEAEHIKSDFWCIKGKFKNCQTCQHEGEWSDRCAYCKSNKDDVGELTEWELKEEYR